MPFNVIADDWFNGDFCLIFHTATREQAQIWADTFTEKYEGKPYPNGNGWYKCKNFRVVKVKTGGRHDHEITP